MVITENLTHSFMDVTRLQIQGCYLGRKRDFFLKSLLLLPHYSIIKIVDSKLINASLIQLELFAGMNLK